MEDDDAPPADEPLSWPLEFVCPISGSPMADPVIVASGQTYERSCIEAWFGLGKRTCLKNGTPIEHPVLFPNSALQATIRIFARRRGLPVPEPPSAKLAMALARNLAGEKEEVVKEEEEEEDGRHRVKDADAGAALANGRMVEDGAGSQQSPMRQPKFGKSASVVESSEQMGRLSLRQDARNEGRRQWGGARALATVAQPARYFHSASGPSLREADAIHRRSVGRGGEEQGVPLPLATRPVSYRAEEGAGDGEGARGVWNSGSNTTVDATLMADLIAKMRQAEVLEQLEGAVAEVLQLSRQSSQNRIALCEKELLEAIAPLLRNRKHPSIQINAAAAMVNLSLEQPNKIKMVRGGAVPFLIEVLKSGQAEAQGHAAGALFSLALKEENRIPIGVLGAILPLLHLLNSGSPTARRDAAMALYQLSHAPSNRIKLVRLGAVPILLGLAQEEPGDLASRALLILCSIAAIPDGRTAMLELNAIQTLVELLAPRRAEEGQAKGIEEMREHAAATLLLLSQSNIRFKSLAMLAGAQELLVMLSEDGTPRAKEKAVSLLAIMRETSPDSDLFSEESIFPRHFGRRTPERPGFNTSDF